MIASNCIFCKDGLVYVEATDAVILEWNQRMKQARINILEEMLNE